MLHGYAGISICVGPAEVSRALRGQTLPRWAYTQEKRGIKHFSLEKVIPLPGWFRKSRAKFTIAILFCSLSSTPAAPKMGSSHLNTLPASLQQVKEKMGAKARTKGGQILQVHFSPRVAALTHQHEASVPL